MSRSIFADDDNSKAAVLLLCEPKIIIFNPLSPRPPRDHVVDVVLAKYLFSGFWAARKSFFVCDSSSCKTAAAVTSDGR